MLVFLGKMTNLIKEKVTACPLPPLHLDHAKIKKITKNEEDLEGRMGRRTAGQKESSLQDPFPLAGNPILNQFFLKCYSNITNVTLLPTMKLLHAKKFSGMYKQHLLEVY